VTIAWWGGWDVRPLTMDARAWHGQPWRLASSALPHIDVFHLALNLYWLWVFGTLVESVLGHGATAGLVLLFAIGSSAAEYALFDGGVGLSGVGYGLFGLLWVLAHRDPRFRGAVDRQIASLFLGWFVLCCFLTATGAWPVANAAHAGGALLGVLVGFVLSARGAAKMALSGVLFGAVIVMLACATVARPVVNFGGHVAEELALLGYLDLERDHNESAAEKLRRAVTMDAGRADWWYNLGLALQRVNDDEGSLAAYRRARDLNPAERDFRTAVGALKASQGYRKQLDGDLETAVKLYRDSLSEDDRQHLCWYNLGTAYGALGRAESAREAFEKAVALEPSNTHYRSALESVRREK